ncbi:MAG: 2-oxoglutarate dehydrogenase complex dihydrolipoyllysine-residue succinyltransferase [Bacteroidales bacterium]|jgi:2-oxoglutarate dehydrogenase E2 component (dihydrolipoamide succinyltransferase)|nr:2-oxoglutarate dehydrogenase complex dihydrolipoyllysine-residue succinyltransferase [Bacteroidales bacterium]
MIVEIKVPSPGESITEVQIASWLVEDGSLVQKDQEIAEIDSDKATLSISAEVSGKIKLLAEEGDTVDIGTVVCSIDSSFEVKEVAAAPKKEESQPKAEEKPSPKIEKKSADPVPAESDIHISPLARKLMQEKNIDEGEITTFYKSLRLGTKDVEFYLDAKDKQVSEKAGALNLNSWGGTRNQETKKMSLLRKKLAQRLVSVKNETAMLTTFNEVNMTPIMEIRKKYKEQFKEQHGVGLGFMSFFTKAVTEALQHFPQVNSMINGDEIISFDYADISIAVSSPKGLVVPVIRNAETLNLAEIEFIIKELAVKARNGKLSLEEMTGGTFTITNGGVFGSMLSTPIINPPQSAILGMHNIVERPIAVNGKVEIHPIMYLALSYDHRVIDGKDSVGFLVKVKEMLEYPENMLFGGSSPIEKLLGF